MDNTVIEKLKKILTLANNEGATQGEVEAAIARAREIAVKHNIELSSIDLTQDTSVDNGFKIEKEETKAETEYFQPYYHSIFNVLQNVFEVKIIYYTYRKGSCLMLRRFHIIGTAVDIALAKAIFPYLEQVFPKMLRAEIKTGRLQRNTATVNGFYQGLAHGIALANKRKQQEEEKTESYALVLRKKEDLIKEFQEEEYENVKTRKDRSTIDAAAWLRGGAEGKKINLSQLNSKTTKHLN